MSRQTIRGLGLVGIVACAVLVLGGCPLGNQIVYFPDQALESAVRASIHKPFGLLTQNDMRDVRVIDGAGLGIQSLEGLETCIFLTHLDLRSNSVSNIRQLADLQELRWLDLGDNFVRDIEPLADLLFLEYANLFGANMELMDFTPLAANANATDSSLPGGILVLPAEITIDAEGDFFPDFQVVYDQLIARGVTVIFADASETEIQL